MADEQKFDLSLTGPQMDFVGGLTVTTLNAAKAQAKVAAEVYEALRAAVAQVQAQQAEPPPSPKPAIPASRMTVVPDPTPEPETAAPNA